VARKNTIEILINATDNASRTLRDAANSIQNVGKTATTIAAVGLAAATAATVGFAAASVSAFNDFERGMAEVFTLLPELNETVMGQMEEGIQRISKRFGTLTDEAVPALYQAISASVPPENVFQFLEVANKAAIGGVTDLETAVDGISSVMNAYGDDVINAAQASDLMFTAVRLGKTNFDQLSSSLFNVVPIASSMGLGFENITAALAGMTAQGVPTSVATTQLRSALTELADSGTDASKAFTDIAGVGFRDFIAEGGNLADALQILEQAASDSNIPIDEMFGSVEAGQAVLALTGANMETFRRNLGEMANSTGATEAAFETMQNTMSFQLGRMRAAFENLLIDAGRLIEPFITPIIRGMADVINIFASFFRMGDSGLDNMQDALAETPRLFRPLVRILAPIIAAFSQLAMDLDPNNPNGFFGALANGADLMLLLEVTVRQFFRTVGFGEGIFSTFVTIFQNFIRPAFDMVNRFIDMKDVMIALGIAIASFVIPALIGIAGAIVTALAPFVLLIAAVAALRTAWENDFFGIQDVIETFVINTISRFNQLKKRVGILIRSIFNEPLEDAQSNLQRIVNAVTPLFRELSVFFSRIFGDVDTKQATDLASTIFNIGRTILQLASPLGRISFLFEKIFNISLFELALRGFEKITEVATLFFQSLNLGISPIDSLKRSLGNPEWLDVFLRAITTVSGFISNTVIPALNQLKDWFLTVAVPKIASIITGTLIPSVQSLLNWLGNLWSQAQPSLTALGNWFIQVGGQIFGIIQNRLIPLFITIGQTLLDMWIAAKPGLTALANFFLFTIVPAIGDIITNILLPAIDILIGALTEIWTAVSPFLTQLINWWSITFVPTMTTLFDTVLMPAIQAFIDLLISIWNLVSPGLNMLKDWFLSTGLQEVVNFVSGIATTAFNNFIDVLSTVLGTITTVVNAVSSALTDISNFANAISEGGISGGIDLGLANIQQFGSTVSGAVSGAFSGNRFGGSVQAGVPTVVGEGGRELFVPQSDGQIINNQDTESALGGSPNVTVNIILNGMPSDADAREAANRTVRELRSRGVAV
jgi:TP901 family phage tail tape measure protein